MQKPTDLKLDQVEDSSCQCYSINSYVPIITKTLSYFNYLNNSVYISDYLLD